MVSKTIIHKIYLSFYNPCSNYLGDSGSLLIVGNEAVGVASSGVRLCGHRTPDIYVKIWWYYGWIQNTIQRNS